MSWLESAWPCLLMLCSVRRKLRAVAAQRASCACSAWRLQLACLYSADGREPPNSTVAGLSGRAAGEAVRRLCNPMHCHSCTDSCARTVQCRKSTRSWKAPECLCRNGTRPRSWTGPFPLTGKRVQHGHNQSARRLRPWGCSALQVGLACLAAVRGVPASTRHALQLVSLRMP